MAALFWRLFHKHSLNFAKKYFCVMSNTKTLHMQQQHCCCCICNICICADYTQHEQIATVSSSHIVGFWDKYYRITCLGLPAKCRVSYLISFEPQPHQVTMDTIHSNKVKQLGSPFHLQFFHHTSNLMKVWFNSLWSKLQWYYNHYIFCKWLDRCAVVVCAKNWSDPVMRNNSGKIYLPLNFEFLVTVSCQ